MAGSGPADIVRDTRRGWDMARGAWELVVAFLMVALAFPFASRLGPWQGAALGEATVIADLEGIAACG